MIRLHMLNHDVIRCPACKLRFQLCKPFICKILIHRIHNGNFLIHDHIRIICHAIWHNILSLKQIDLMVIHTDILNIICNCHFFFLLPLYFYLYIFLSAGFLFTHSSLRYFFIASTAIQYLFSIFHDSIFTLSLSPLISGTPPY